MLKRKIIRNLSLIISLILAIVIINVFPKTNKNISYVKTFSNNNSYIYLLDSNNYVSKVSINYKSDDMKNLIYEIINTLTIGTNESNNLRNGFKPVIPENTKLLFYQLNDDKLTLNFNSNLLNVSDEFESKMIEALIYSFTEIKDINNIVIKVNNNVLTTLPHSKKSLPNILDRSYSINKEVNITSLNNIEEVTVYYLANYDDYNYYVPVTKVINNDKDKINVIIKELKSSTTYNTNLVNYLSNNSLLESASIVDDSMILKFSSFDYNKDILENITYAINTSIKDNYNVKEVIYYIDDTLFNNYSLI